MSWQIAVLLHLIFTTAFALVQRSFAKKYPDKALLSIAVMYVLTVTPIGIVYALFSGDISFDFPLYIWGFLVLGGTFFALGNIIGFTANAKVDAAQFSIVSNFRVVTTVIVSSIFLSEFLNTKQYIGALLLILAAIWIAISNRSKDTWKIDKYTLLAIVSAFFFGVGISTEKFLLDNMTFSTYLIVGWGFQTMMMSLFAVKQLRGVVDFVRSRAIGGILSLGLLRTIAGFMLVYALVASDNSSLISSAVSYKTALVVLSSYIVLREREKIPIKLAGTVIATIGLILLI